MKKLQKPLWGHLPIFSAADLKTNLIIKQHYCVMDNTTVNKMDVTKIALQWAEVV